MTKTASWVLLALTGLLAGCATAARYSAAGDVHDFLLSVRDDDRAAFNAHVDRAALEGQLQSVLVAQTRAARASPTMKGVGLLASGPASRLAGSLLLRPEVFRAVAEYYGYRPDTPVPARLAIAASLRPAPDGRMCASVRSNQRCLLVFAHEQGVWRLVGFEGDTDMLRWSGR